MGFDPTAIIKALIDGAKGSVDYLAFALLSVLAVVCLTNNVGFLQTAGITLVLGVMWIGMRYALLSIQSKERLRGLREDAMIEAQKKLEKYATPEELEDLFSRDGLGGGDHEP